MDDMSWFGVAYYIVLFTIIYLIGLGIFKIAEHLDNKAYQDGYDDGFEDGTEHGIDLTWDQAYKSGSKDGGRRGYNQAKIDMASRPKPGVTHMKIKRVSQLDEDTIILDLEEE